MEKVLNWIIGILFILSLIANIILGICLSNKKTDIIERKIEVHDTTTVVRDSIISHTVTKYVTNFDTLVYIIKDTDSLEVPIELPIEHKTYRDTINKDSIVYDIQVDYSGYKPSLDLIKLDSKYVKEETIITKPKHWRQFIGVGVQVGYGVTIPQPKFEPYVGVGITYGFGYTW